MPRCRCKRGDRIGFRAIVSIMLVAGVALIVRSVIKKSDDAETPNEEMQDESENWGEF